MSKIEPELISGMGYVGTSPGVLYRMTPAGKHLTAGGGSTVVINGAKDNAPLDRLTLHGGSTQGSTTGAQLFDKSKAFAGWVNSDGSINNVGTVGKGDNIVSEYIPFEAGKQYFCGSDFVWIYNTEKGFVKKADTELKGRVFTSPDNAGFFVVAFSISAEEALAKLNEIMINVGSVKKTYEPYTGGAPSPSPEYPQEIESAGMDGEIGVEVLGKNLIPFPYPILGGAGTQVEKNGVKYTVQTDGGIRCVGTPTSVFGVTLTKIRFSDIQLSVQNPTDGKVVLSGGDLFFDCNNSSLFIYFKESQVGKPLDTVIYPQIELGTVATSYEPYKPVQTLIIPTPDGLPGIPVSSGGNYTDEKGQQWVCDEIDLAKGERVQQTIKVVLDGSQKITLQKHLDFNRFAIGENDFPIPSGYAGFCSHFIVNPSPVTMNTIDGAICVYSNGNIYLRSDRFKSADELKSFLKENPVTLEYCLAEPIRTPLPPETIAAYKALRTYSPTTTIVNDAGAGMSVGYKGKRG